MKTLFKRFRRDRSGAFAIQFALMIIPLVACTGLAIDGGRAFLARYELASALDAAALAVGSTDADQDVLEELAEKYVARNFKTRTTSPVVLTLSPDAAGESFTLRGEAPIENFFMPLFGQPTTTIAAESEVRRGGSDVEVAMILDVTGSMKNQRLADLKVAATALVETVVAENQTPYFSRLAMIPYSNSVYVGALTQDAAGNDDNAKTIEARGSIEPAKTITGAAWRVGELRNVTAAAWRDGNRMTIKTAAWKNGTTTKTLKSVTQAAEAVFETTADHGYSDGTGVHITGVTGMTALNNKSYTVTKVDNRKFKLKLVGSTAFVNTNTGFSATSGGVIQPCLNGSCEVRVETDNNHGFNTNDRIAIQSVSGMTQINTSAALQSWAVTKSSDKLVFLQGSDGPAYGAYSNANDYASKCILATCDIRITTNANHGFQNGDRVNIYNVAGITEVNNTTSVRSWTIASASNATYTLANIYGPAQAPSSTFSGADGRTGKCIADTCEVQITSAAHGFTDNQWIRIGDIGGVTYPNSKNWQVTGRTTDTYRLAGSLPKDNTGNYTANTGNGWCTNHGCEWYRYTSPNNTVRTYRVSNCVTERTGAQAFTDAAPADAPVGLMYPIATNDDTSCPTHNTLMGLTDDRDGLLDAIDALQVDGTTSGQIGLAWGWYALSNNWSTFWPGEHDPSVERENLAKVAVLMTDGAFNTGYCNGVIAQDSDYPSAGNRVQQRINCDATNGDAFEQAAQLCTNMKAQQIHIYTVGFGFADGSAEDEWMEACASREADAYLASDGEELLNAFQSIATSISLLRLSR